MEAKSSNQTRKSWIIEDLGLIHYDEALQLQEQCWESVRNGSNHYLLLLEHPSVLTFGRRSKDEHILVAETELTQLGVELHKIDRGGSVTYHGPGQLVGYIICKSSRYGGIANVVSLLMNSLVNTLTELGVESQFDNENPGIWTKDLSSKIGAIGMSNRYGITMHGFSLNLKNNLEIYSKFVPCGLTAPVSTVELISNQTITMDKLKEIFKTQFLTNFV